MIESMNESNSSRNDTLGQNQPYRSPSELSETVGRKRWLPILAGVGILLTVSVAGAYFLFSPRVQDDIANFGASRGPVPSEIAKDLRLNSSQDPAPSKAASNTAVVP